MSVLRPVLVGLGAGAVVAFVVALLAPRPLHEDTTAAVGGWDDDHDPGGADE